MTNPKLDAALDAARRGFRVFPIGRDSRIPWEKGWQTKATSDEGQITAWWSENRNYNVGIATGQGLLVVDVDVKDGKRGAESLEMLEMLGLPPTLKTRTPSGGIHLYFDIGDKDHAGRVDNIPDYPGIDTRCKGNLTLWPGSNIGRNRYELVDDLPIAPCPDWLFDIIETKVQSVERIETSSVEADLPEHVNRARLWLESQAPSATQGAGGDNTTFSVAAELRALGVSEETALDLMLEHWNEEKASPPWQPDELAVKVKNAYQHGQGALGGKTAQGEMDVIEIEPPSPELAERIKAHVERMKAVSEMSIQISDNPPSKKIHASPYKWIEPSAVPPRDWVLGKHLIRKFVSVTVAPGSVGKSSLLIAEMIAMASGKPLLGYSIPKPLRVWYWNLEDPYDELQRRIQAACQFHGISLDDIGDRLFIDSGREQALRIAIADKNGAKIVKPVVDGVVSEMLVHRIDVLAVDPFVSSHGVPENDNLAIDMVAKEWGKVADRANAAIDLVHHTRKQNGEEASAESARGGKALVDAARDVRVLNRMSKEEAAKAGIENNRLFFRTYSDKANLAPPADHSDWFKLESVPLGNGDEVGVVVRWEWPDPFEDITREHAVRVQAAIRDEPARADIRADAWVGKIVAEVVGLNIEIEADKERVKQIVQDWIAKKWLKTARQKNEKGKEQVIVLVGKSALETEFDEGASADTPS